LTAQKKLLLSNDLRSAGEQKTFEEIQGSFAIFDYFIVSTSEVFSTISCFLPNP